MGSVPTGRGRVLHDRGLCTIQADPVQLPPWGGWGHPGAPAAAEGQGLGSTWGHWGPPGPLPVAGPPWPVSSPQESWMGHGGCTSSQTSAPSPELPGGEDLSSITSITPAPRSPFAQHATGGGRIAPKRGVRRGRQPLRGSGASSPLLGCDWARVASAFPYAEWTWWLFPKLQTLQCVL